MKSTHLPRGLKRILVVCPNWLGDVLFTTPFLRALKSAYPEAIVDALLPQRVHAVLKNNPNIHQAIPYQERIHLRSLFRSAELLRRIRHCQYDACILLNPSRSKSLLMKFAGIPIRAGWGADHKKTFLTHSLPAPSMMQHKVDQLLDLGSGLGVAPRGREMDFFSDRLARDSVRQKLRVAGKADSEPYSVLHVGGNWHLKRWPIEYFGEWAHLWLSQKQGYLVICGTPAENGLAKSLIEYVKDPRVLSLCGQTSLDELAWLLKEAQLTLSNDSGPVHLAASQKTPVVALFGPTASDITGPVSAGKLFIFQSRVGCEVPCYFRACNDHLCMRSLSPAPVFEKALELAR